MSRYRNDDDETYYSGRPRPGRRDEGRYGTEGTNYSRGYEDHGRTRPRGDRPGYERDDYPRPDDPRGPQGYDGRYDRSYGDEGRYERDYDAPEGRSLMEEGRDYLRRTLGMDEGRRRRRPARSRLRCRDIMTRDVAVATPDTTLRDVAMMMREEDAGVIPVVERQDTPVMNSGAPVDNTPRIAGRVHSVGKLVGLITDRDIVIRAIAEGKDALTTRAEDVMTTDIHTAHPNDRVIDAIRKMGDKQVRRIPVVGENGNLRGIISMADVALETEEDRELADALEEISSGAGVLSCVSVINFVGHDS